MLVSELALAFLIQVVPGGHVIQRAAIVVIIAIYRVNPRWQLVERAVGFGSRGAPAVDQHHLFRAEGVVEVQRILPAQDAKLGDERLFVAGVKHCLEKVVEGLAVGHTDFHACSCSVVVAAPRSRQGYETGRSFCCLSTAAAIG
ncbi:hypothetical protein D3C78_1470020 [compost metagenome]